MTIPATAAHVAFTLPVILPASEGIREVTHDEIHALELGFIVGIASAWLYVIGRTAIVGTIVVVFIFGSLEYRRYSIKAFKTVRKEPWYGLIARRRRGRRLVVLPVRPGGDQTCPGVGRAIPVSAWGCRHE